MIIKHFKKTILNLGNLASYYACLSIISLSSLEQRRTEQSLMVVFQSFGMHGPTGVPDYAGFR